MVEGRNKGIIPILPWKISLFAGWYFYCAQPLWVAMNVGQVFECLLLGRTQLGLRFKLTPFDDVWLESSRTLVHDKL